MAKTTEQYLERRVKGCLEAYLDGKQKFNWIVGIIEKGGVRGQALKDIFGRLQNVGSRERFKEVYEHCQKEKWF